MDVENNNVINADKTRNLPLQQFHLPYDQETPVSSRIMRPFNMTTVNATSLPAEAYAQRYKVTDHKTWSTTDNANSSILDIPFTYEIINKLIVDSVPEYLVKAHMAHSFAIRIQLEMHQSMQHQGLLAAYWFPGPTNVLTGSYGRIDTFITRQIMYLNPTFITPQSNKTYEFNIPIRQHWDNFFTSSSTEGYEFGTFKLVVFSKLNTVAEKISLPLVISYRLVDYAPMKLVGE